MAVASPAAGVFIALLSIVVPPLQNSSQVLWWLPGRRRVTPASLLLGATVLQQEVLVGQKASWRRHKRQGESSNYRQPHLLSRVWGRLLRWVSSTVTVRPSAEGELSFLFCRCYLLHHNLPLGDAKDLPSTPVNQQPPLINVGRASSTSRSVGVRVTEELLENRDCVSVQEAQQQLQPPSCAPWRASLPPHCCVLHCCYSAEWDCSPTRMLISPRIRVLYHCVTGPRAPGNSNDLNEHTLEITVSILCVCVRASPPGPARLHWHRSDVMSSSGVRRSPPRGLFSCSSLQGFLRTSIPVSFSLM